MARTIANTRGACAPEFAEFEPSLPRHLLLVTTFQSLVPFAP